jgi:hypothetical protein
MAASEKGEGETRWQPQFEAALTLDGATISVNSFGAGFNGTAEPLV